MDLPQVLQIRGNNAIVYTDRSYLPRKKSVLSLTANFKGAKTYSGSVTLGVQKKIRKTVSIMVQRSLIRSIYNPITKSKQKFSLGFLTLTIPDKTTLDARLYYQNLLKPYLRILRERFNVKNYIWKAELQARGSIHYHLTIDEFIPYYHLRDEWNKLLVKNDLMQDYRNKFGNVNPNSIDVHSVRNITNLEAYLAKYLSKSKQNEEKLIGKVWGCSDSLSNASFFSKVVSSELYSSINRAVSELKIQVLELEQCSVVKLIKGFSWMDICNDLGSLYSNWCRGIAVPVYKFVPAPLPVPIKNSKVKKSIQLYLFN